MGLAVSDATRAILRAQKQESQVWVGVQTGRPAVFQTTVTAYDAGTFTVTCADNVPADVRAGMTLAVGTADDNALYGAVRIKRFPAANQIQVEPNSVPAYGGFNVGDVLTVDGVYRLYRKLPEVTAGVTAEDYDLTYGAPDNAGWGGQPPPFAIMGPPRAGFRTARDGSTQQYRFYGYASYARDIGANITAWAWDFDDGVIVAGAANQEGTVDNPIVVEFPTAGEKLITLTVTDSNGKTHTAVRPALIYERTGANMPYQVKAGDIQWQGSGWQCTIEAWYDAGKAKWPDNCLVVVWAEDWYDGVQQSFGSVRGCEEILFVGWVKTDSVKVSASGDTVTFSAYTIDKALGELDIWPINFANSAAAPAAWANPEQIQDMRLEDVWHWLISLRSNLKDLVDCYMCSDMGLLGGKALDYIDLTEATLKQQASDQIGSCFFGDLLSSRFSSVHVNRDRNMLTMAQRSVLGQPLMLFEKRDWFGELDIGDEQQRDAVCQVDFIGFIYDANSDPIAVYSLAPEWQKNYGDVIKVDGILLSGDTVAAAQAECNEQSGLYFAWKNVRFPRTLLRTGNNRMFDPAWQDLIAIYLEPEDNARGLDWPSKEFIVRDATIHVAGGFIEVDYGLEASTWGPAGVGGEGDSDYPSSPEYPPSPHNPPDPFLFTGDGADFLVPLGGATQQEWPSCAVSDTVTNAAWWALTATIGGTMFVQIGELTPSFGVLYTHGVQSVGNGPHGLLRKSPSDRLWCAIQEVGPEVDLEWADPPYAVWNNIQVTPGQVRELKDFWVQDDLRMVVMTQDTTAGLLNYHMYVTTDGGVTWNESLRTSCPGTPCYCYQVGGTPSHTLCLRFTDAGGTNDLDLLYELWGGGGSGSVEVASQAECGGCCGDICSVGNTVYVAYRCPPPTGGYEIRLWRGTDNGAAVVEDLDVLAVSLADDPGAVQVACSGSRVTIAYLLNLGAANAQVYVVNSFDGGATWGEPVPRAYSDYRPDNANDFCVGVGDLQCVGWRTTIAGARRVIYDWCG